MASTATSRMVNMTAKPAQEAETNQTKRGSKFTIGDDTPSSPVGGLQVLLQPDSD
jgi:hypothetical protein